MSTHNMSNNRSLIRAFLALSVVFLLAACEGASTVNNPDFNSGDGSYSGPPARTADIRSFQLNFWDFLKEENRCGTCHGNNQTPVFVDLSDVNAAYSVAVQYVNLTDPGASSIVAKAATGHQCWLGQANGAACAANIEQMISNWATDSNITSSRVIQLSAPTIRDPGDAKSFPPSALTPGVLNGSTFAGTVHPILVANCQNCHQETATPLPIAPFFANDDPESSFQAAKPKMNIDDPSLSRFVVRLRDEAHNCWTDCADDFVTMQDAIATFADGIEPTAIDPALITSKALFLTDGILAAGGNRHESNMFAIWEFRQSGGNLAFDTSGIDPSITLQIRDSFQWLGGYGLDLTNGYAFASNFDSVKLKTFIEATGEYAIEAWVIPANVTQQNANILGYTGGGAKNFSLGQELYNYEFYNRIDDPDPLTLTGQPLYTTGDSNEELLQSSLQHIVANYDPIDGRSLYINGQLVEDPNALGVSLERNPGPTSLGIVWNNNFSFVIGGEIGGPAANDWDGQIRLIAIHNRTLSAAQVLQNFDVGVGEKFFMLFYVGDRIGIPESYILFEVSQFDSYSYLFSTPTFINLDPDWTPVSIPIRGLRIGINGKEANAGQAFANLDTTVNAGAYDPQFGQVLSPIGTIIALEKSATTDEFFLTFELLGTQSNAFVDPQPPAPAPPVDPATPVVSDIGFRTFEEINASISVLTGIPVTNPLIDSVYDDYIQQLPSTEAFDAFLPSHQMAVAQLALTSCSVLVDTNQAYFAPFVFSALEDETVAFDTATKRNQIINPLLAAVTNYDGTQNLTSQPIESDLRDMFGSNAQVALDPVLLPGIQYDSLISHLIANCTENLPTTDCNSSARTEQIVKAVCASAVGGAVTLVQ